MRSEILTTGNKQDSLTDSSAVSVQLGFTLLELLVVLTILVMVVLAVPTIYSRTHQAMTLKTTTAAVVQSLRSLQLQAMSQGQVQTWMVASDKHGYVINDQTTTFLASNKVNLRFEPLSVNFLKTYGRDASQYSAVVKFYPDGSASGGHLFVANDLHTGVIEIDWLTGRIRIDE